MSRYFAGGTALVLSLNAYRESVDIDFVCASNEGYRLLRNTVSEQGLGALLVEPQKYIREVRADQYRVRTVIDIDGEPIRVERIREARIAISGSIHPLFGVPILAREAAFIKCRWTHNWQPKYS